MWGASVGGCAVFIRRRYAKLFGASTGSGQVIWPRIMASKTLAFYTAFPIICVNRACGKMGNGMDGRLDALQEGARTSGFTMDYLDYLTEGLSLQAARKVIGNASSMPSNMKSSDNPYVRRSARAPSSDSR